MSAQQREPATNVAIVGCGIRGNLFATALSRNPDVVLVAVVDANTQRASELARETGAKCYAEVSEMLDQHPELQAAIISTPDFAHTDAAVACASRGIHLMIEKPLAMDVASAQRILGTATTADAQIMVAFENRWNSRFIETRRLIDEGAIGNVTNLIAQLNDTIYVPTQMLPWAEKSSPAWFLMPHTLDLALWFTRETPVEVYATGTRGVLEARGVDTWDSITALFRLTNGTTVTLHSSWVLPESKPAVFDLRVEVQGSEGLLSIDGATHGMTLYGPDHASWPQLGVHWRGNEFRGFPVDMVNDFVGSVRGESVDIPAAKDGLIVTAGIEAIHRSLEEGKPVLIAVQ